MTNQRTGNESIIFHNHPLFLPTVLYVGSVPVNEHILVKLVISNTTDRVTSSLKN